MGIGSSIMAGIEAAMAAASAASQSPQASFGPGPSWTPEESQAAIAANNAVIQKEVAALKNDADIDAYLARTTYTPEQLSLATGYSQESIANRMQSAWQGQAMQNPVNTGGYVQGLANAPDSGATKVSDMTALDLAKYYYNVTAASGGDTVANREQAIKYLKSAGATDAQLDAGYKAYLNASNTNNWLNSAYTPTSKQAPTPGFSIGGTSAPQVSSGGSYASGMPSVVSAPAAGSQSSTGLINSVVTNPSYQSTRPNVFVPSAGSAPALVSVNESRTSLPQMNSSAVSAISGLPINQSRFANAGQPAGMLYQPNPNYLSDIDLQKTLTPQDYISRFGVKL